MEQFKPTSPPHMEKRQCSSCHTPEHQLPKPLKQCAKCKQALYCSRECQKADWKQHKPNCSCQPSATTAATEPSAAPLETTRFVISKPFTAIQNGTWFHNRPEKDVYQLFIDIYRLRIEDEYKFEGEVSEGSLYSGAGPAQALRHFYGFLRNAVDQDTLRPQEKRLLPAWWSEDSLDACIEMASTGKDSNIAHAVEKHDIQEFYGQDDMPMQLRMMGEGLDGFLTTGRSRETMLQMQVMVESESLPEGSTAMTMDIARMFGR